MVPDDTQQLISSRYRLVELLGRGGMGEVWEAEDTVLGRRVAVKVIDLARTGDRKREEIRERAMREGRAAAQIDHPHSVRVFDVVDDDDHLYLVLELVRAASLADEVRRDGPLDPRTAARVGLDVLDALEAAHRAGVVHRDVKPANVFVLPDGRVKLGDFGIASIKEDPDLTATGLVLGTPKYLSPEAARGERAGAPADIWGLGALLYFAVEGGGPFDRDGTLPTLHAVINEEPRPITRAGPLAPVITAFLAKDPAARPTDASAKAMLEQAARGESTTVLAAPTPVPPAAVRREPPRRGGGGALVAGLAALLLLGALGLVLARNTSSDKPSAATTTTTAAGEATVGGAAGVETTETTAATTTTTAATSTTLDAAPPDGVPAGWVPYQGDRWTIWHPATWTPRAAGAGQVDFVAPNGDYLRVGSVSPASNGGDPVAAWEAQEKSFRQRHPDYERIRIDSTDFRGNDAAIWEYTFEGKHADNLGFVIGDTGFALNFVTAMDRWDSSGDVHDAFRSGFEPAA
jgi:hypothetical protein